MEQGLGVLEVCLVEPRWEELLDVFRGPIDSLGRVVRNRFLHICPLCGLVGIHNAQEKVVRTKIVVVRGIVPPPAPAHRTRTLVVAWIPRASARCEQARQGIVGDEDRYQIWMVPLRIVQ